MCGGATIPWSSGTIRVGRGTVAERRGGPFRHRRYTQCPTCGQIQVHRDDLPPPADERDRYDEHRNDLSDPRYRDYLNTFLDTAVSPFLEPDARVLDFGSGPTPALAELLRERACAPSIYDPFYAPDQSVLEGAARYDAIVALEVVEHLHQPGEELPQLIRLLVPGGYLAVRTGIFSGDTDAFDRWWYRRDVSHVSFWTDATIDWLCSTYALTNTLYRPGTVLVFRTRPDYATSHENRLDLGR
jgi:SAM-dependent methyltransferase